MRLTMPQNTRWYSDLATASRASSACGMLFRALTRSEPAVLSRETSASSRTFASTFSAFAARCTATGLLTLANSSLP